ncbi:Immunity protein 49 [Chryseobacterium arachidis]|uniref:Immunity protein 49 n=3 Tax=Chryseobacterium arachidis TaxID=1416778 RepID=A0A1M5HUX6_9FLAO|nr:Immunity protein 49 [Chryseobacterium arachidis]
MQNKIVLPFFTDEKFAGRPLTLVDCLSFLARRDGSHLLLMSNFTELHLFKYSEDFVFEKEIPVRDVLNGFRQFDESREYALSESISGQIIISGPANRCYIIDENGNIDPASYTTTIVNLHGDAHALFPQMQEAAAKNLYCNATLLPESNKLIALVDSEMGWGSAEGKRRGDFIVVSDAPFDDATRRPRLKLLAALDKRPGAMYTTDFPGIELKNGSTIHRDDTFEDNLIEPVRINNKMAFFDPWIGNIYPLTESLLLVPVFDRFRRLSADTCFLLVNTDGSVVGQLQDIEPKNIKLGKLQEFHFAVNHQDEIIYFKGENTLYLFGFDGTCLDKIILEGVTKPLAAFQLIGHTTNGNLLFFDRKNFHFLQLPQLKPLDNNVTIIENALINYKKYKLTKPKISAKKVKDDKHIYLHKVDHPEIIESNFEWIQEKFEHALEKSKGKFRFLYYLFRDAQQLLQMSVLQTKSMEEQRNWFRYGLNSISEFCRLIHFKEETKEATIDDSGTFEITVEPSGEYVDVITALYWAIIARDAEKQKIIANSPIKNWIYREEDWDKNTFGTCFLRLIKEYYLTGNFNTSLYDIAQADLEKYKSSLGPDVKQKFGWYLRSRFLNAFKSLIDNNETEFNFNFALAIQSHKEVWSQKKALNRGGTPLCRENEGFLSWDCTALAAMAFDKGWKLEISSDYVPQFMVDGSINQ